jgi:hypothetical protein
MRADMSEFIKKYKIPTFGFMGHYKAAEKCLMDSEEVLFLLFACRVCFKITIIYLHSFF